MNFKKKLVKTTAVLAIPVALGLSSLTAPAFANYLTNLAKFDFIGSKNSSEILENSTKQDSAFILAENISDKVMISDLNPNFASQQLSLDSLFSTLNLNDTLPSGYFPMADTLSHDEVLSRQIYNRHRIVQKSGDEYYSDWKSLKWSKLSKLIGVTPGLINYDSRVKEDFFNKFGTDVADITRKYSISPSDFIALIFGESGANQFSLSWTYCVGLGQLSTGVLFPKSPFPYFVSQGTPKKINPFNVVDVLDRSAMLYSSLLKTFNGDRDLALTAYNAGSGTVNSAIAESGSTDLASILESDVLSSEAKQYAAHVRSSDNLAASYVRSYIN